MALIKDPLFQKWRSTHGAVVGQSTRSGAIARLHAESVQRTQTIKPQRDWVMRSLISSWRGLSTIQKMSWDEFGVSFPQEDRYENLIEISGWDWFVKLNSVALLWSNSFNFTPPDSPTPDYLPSMGFLDGGSGNPIYFELSPFPIPAFNSIRIHRLLNRPTSTEFAFPLQFFSSFTGAIGFLTPVAWPSELSVAIQAHYFSAVAMDSYGRMSPLITSRILRSA
jgi:hypothetical protein